MTMHYSQLGWSEALVAAGDVSLSSSALLHAVVLRNCLGDIAERTQKFKCGTTSSAKRLPKSSNAMYLNYK